MRLAVASSAAGSTVGDQDRDGDESFPWTAEELQVWWSVHVHVHVLV